MAPRVRIRDTNGCPKGYRWRSGIVSGGGYVWDLRSGVSDQTGPGDCAPFEVWKQTISGGMLNRLEDNPRGGGMENYRCDFFDFPGTFGHLHLFDSPDNVTVATAAASRTNPSRPYVDVAANILELGDITDLIRTSGWAIIQRIFQYKAYRNRHGYKKAMAALGDINLTAQFGFIPLVGDLAKILDFQSAIDNRLAEFERIAGPRGYRRTVRHGSYSRTDTTNEVMQSQDRFVRTDCHWKTIEEVRAHIRWTTDDAPFFLKSNPNLRAQTLNALYNTDLNAGALWEGIPWSWLIDWGTNVGQYFKATRNVVPARLDGVHVIRHQKTEMLSDPTSTESGVFLSEGRMTYETKKRTPSFVSIAAHFPFLSGNQMGILASLAVTRK